MASDTESQTATRDQPAYESFTYSPIEHPDLPTARGAARDEADSSFGQVFPVIVFKQGRRTMLSTSFPMRLLARYITLDPAVKGESPREKYNRPLMSDHARSIRDYLVENPEDYLLPSVTLNVTSRPSLHVQAGGDGIARLGYLVVTEATEFHVTDGQHRIAGLIGYATGRANGRAAGALDEVDSLRADAISVLIVLEPDRSRTQQDFADAAQTKQIPASLLAVYNTREPINQVLARITEGSDLLRGRIDEMSKTLPKMSQHIFLLNQVRGMVKGLLVGDYAMSEDSLSRNAATRLGNRQQREVFVEETLTLLNVLTANMEPWTAVAKMPKSGGQNGDIPRLRNEWINMTATGLNVIGHVTFQINKIPDLAARIALYKRLATDIPWRRSDDFWTGNIITRDQSRGGDSVDKINTTRGPVNLAVNKILVVLGLREPEKDVNGQRSVADAGEGMIA
ncbi:DNA sulfur modification protein DndB [Micromonospora sp. NPDC051925]|uniref:DNA sulfur modification protein DndB n=1 Tax=Micromonospora sp. NPDC051925 TaxID=3364288 RepID=UPI0037C6C184